MEILELTTSIVTLCAIGGTLISLPILKCKEIKIWRQMVQRSRLELESLFKQRYDLISDLFEIIGGFVSVNSVARARSDAIEATWDTKEEKEKALTEALKALFATIDTYPYLRDDAKFSELQQQLLDIETEIPQIKRSYNSAVQILNASVRGLNIIAFLFKIKKEEFFGTPDTEKNNCKNQTIYV